MAATMVSGNAEDFWSPKEQRLRALELEMDSIERTTPEVRRHKLAANVGHSALHNAVFNLDILPEAPLPIGKDPYRRLDSVALR